MPILSLILTLSFPFLGLKLLDFLYGPTSENVMRINSNVIDGWGIYTYFLLFLVVALIFIIWRWREKRSWLKRYLNFAVLLPPLVLWVWLFVQVLDKTHLSIGLNLSVLNGDIKRVERLIFLGANVNTPFELNGMNELRHTPLIFAAGEGHIEMVKLLIDRGAEIGFKNRAGKTARDMALARGHTSVASYLDDLK